MRNMFHFDDSSANHCEVPVLCCISGTSQFRDTMGSLLEQVALMSHPHYVAYIIVLIISLFCCALFQELNSFEITRVSTRKTGVDLTPHCVYNFHYYIN